MSGETAKITRSQMRYAWHQYRVQLEGELREITRRRDLAMESGEEEAAIEANQDGVAVIRELEAIGAYKDLAPIATFRFS